MSKLESHLQGKTILIRKRGAARQRTIRQQKNSLAAKNSALRSISKIPCMTSSSNLSRNSTDDTTNLDISMSLKSFNRPQTTQKKFTTRKNSPRPAAVKLISKTLAKAKTIISQETTSAIKIMKTATKNTTGKSKSLSPKLIKVLSKMNSLSKMAIKLHKRILHNQKNCKRSLKSNLSITPRVNTSIQGNVPKINALNIKSEIKKSPSNDSLVWDEPTSYNELKIKPEKRDNLSCKSIQHETCKMYKTNEENKQSWDWTSEEPQNNELVWDSASKSSSPKEWDWEKRMYVRQTNDQPKNFACGPKPTDNPNNQLENSQNDDLIWDLVSKSSAPKEWDWEKRMYVKPENAQPITFAQGQKYIQNCNNQFDKPHNDELFLDSISKSSAPKEWDWKKQICVNKIPKQPKSAQANFRSAKMNTSLWDEPKDDELVWDSVSKSSKNKEWDWDNCEYVRSNDSQQKALTTEFKRPHKNHSHQENLQVGDLNWDSASKSSTHNKWDWEKQSELKWDQSESNKKFQIASKPHTHDLILKNSSVEIKIKSNKKIDFI